MVRPSVCAILLAITPAVSRSQQPVVSQPLDSGTIVRIQVVSGHRFPAQLIAPFGPESPRLLYGPLDQANCGGPRVPCWIEMTPDQLRALEVRTGSKAWEGALFGGFLGASVGAVVGFGMECPSFVLQAGSSGCWEGPGRVAVTTLLGAATGSLLGALFGQGLPTWGPAP